MPEESGLPTTTAFIQDAKSVLEKYTELGSRLARSRTQKRVLDTDYRFKPELGVALRAVQHLPDPQKIYLFAGSINVAMIARPGGCHAKH